jgi:hypothetical protein
MLSPWRSLASSGDRHKNSKMEVPRVWTLVDYTAPMLSEHFATATIHRFDVLVLSWRL